MRAKRWGSRMCLSIRRQPSSRPYSRGHRRELRVVAALDEAVHVGDHVVVERRLRRSAGCCDAAGSSRTRTRRPRSTMSNFSVRPRSQRRARPAATGRSGARCWDRPAGSSVMSRIHGWRSSAARVRSATIVSAARQSVGIGSLVGITTSPITASTTQREQLVLRAHVVVERHRSRVELGRDAPHRDRGEPFGVGDANRGRRRSRRG